MEDSMKVIKNNRIFDRLMAINELDIREDVNIRLWKCLFDNNGDILDNNIPVLSGGLDSIKVTKNQVCFHDIGSSVGGKLRDNSFIIRRSLNKKTK